MKKNEHPHRELSLPDEEAQQIVRAKTRRSFLVGGLAAAGAVGAYEWITEAASESEVPWPQRRVLDFNGRISEQFLSDKHLMPTYAPDKVGGVKPNGNYGMEKPLDPAGWKLQVAAPGSAPTTLSLADLKQLPKTEITTRLCCIEGWSGIAQWGGLRFSDFTKNFFGPGRRVPDYVYMTTPDGEYYVGLDIKSALHPQTLLAYEQDGKPLEERRGAPLRLAIPVKYGIKNIKRIGLIQYTDKRPADYWADDGYDWFAGL
jgi:DMSO/TMAO reductase YedYZ molybdopterin-dependent catalytic subunit